MSFREEIIGDARLILGDCKEVLPTLQRVDAVVTDPPYGLLFRGHEWDASIPDWLADARAISPVVVFTTAPTTLWDYPRADWILNWYRPASSSRAPTGGFNHWSPVLVYGSPKFPVDTACLHAIKHAQQPGFEHPSPKPVELMCWLAENCADFGKKVLDPFMGSGTTGVACIKLGRKFIGIEIEPKYFDIACRRIEEAWKQPRLFEEPKPKPVQEAML
jgi:site-specific DNA-methyltransferase (adenine-specific)/modification methylase